MKSDSVTFMPCGGLCNRLQNIISAIVFAEEIGVKPNFLWMVHPEVGNGLFDDYFVSDYQFTNMDRKNAELLLDKRGRTTQAGITNQIIYYWGFTHLNCEDPDIAGYRRLVTGIQHNFVKPKPEIQAIVDDYCADNEISSRVGIHMRSYEGSLDYSGSRAEVEDLVLFEQVIHAIAEQGGAKFFLASDSLKIRQVLFEMYKRLIYRIENDTSTPFAERDTVKGTTLGLIDFLILSRCKALIGTRGSSFSHMAGLLGKIPITWMDCQRWITNQEQPWAQGAYWKDGFYDGTKQR